MRVVRFHAPRDVRVEDAPEPAAGPGGLVIRVRNCSVCGTDAKIWQSGHPNLSPPRVLGHEVAGEVVEVGEGAGRWSVGDRVQVIAAIPDGSCHECRHGWPTVCPNKEAIGYQHDGGFAELMRVPAKMLAVDGVNRIPEGLSFAEASVAEPLSCVINGQELAGVGEGQTVVVVGAGPIGCLHVRLARARGAARVVLVELRASRLELAAGLVAPDAAVAAGATDAVAAVRELTGGRGADVIVVAAASARAQQDALRMAARRGTVSFFGGLPKDRPTVSLDANVVHYLEVAVVGANSSSPAHNQQALDLIASGAVPVADLITHRLPLEETVEGFHTVTRGEAMKVTVEP
jgi:L-iditol 2-dehydrogenase